jgi:hypothetical protein
MQLAAITTVALCVKVPHGTLRYTLQLFVCDHLGAIMSLPSQKPMRDCLLATAALTLMLLAQGCIKPTMSTGDSIRTGQGLSSRYLLPRPVTLDDGSQAFCVYVARPSDDPQFFSKVAPGNTAGVEILNPMAIPQGEFLQKLRDPQLMQGAGGIGNTIANDIVTGLGAMGIATAGLTVAQLKELLSRGGPEAKAIRDQAVLTSAKMVEGDAMLEQTVKKKIDALADLVSSRASAADRRNVKQILGLIVESHTGDSAFLQKFVAEVTNPDNETKVLAWLNQELNRRRTLGLGNRPLSANELDGVLLQLRNVFTSRATAGQALLQQIGAAQDAQNKIAGSMVQMRQIMENFARSLGQGSVDRSQSIALTGELIQSFDGALTQEILSNQSLHQAMGLDGGAASTLGNIANAENLRRASRFRGGLNVAGSAARGAGSAGGSQQRTVTRMNRLIDAPAPGAAQPGGLLNTATASADNAAPQIKRNFADMFGDTCWRGGGAAIKAAKVFLCGTAAGVGSVFMKKALFDNGAAMAIKREQIAEALTDENGFMDVNEGTFAAVTEAIRAFTTKAETTGCQ